MLRHPLDHCYEAPLKTSATIFTMALCLLFPFAVAMTYFVAHDTTERYIESYEPIIYLDSEATDDDLNHIMAEALKIGGIETITQRSRDDAYNDLMKELDVTEQKSLGLTSSLFPKSLIVKLKIPYINYTSTFQQLSELKSNPKILDVDVPNTKAARFFDSMNIVLLATLAFTIPALIFAYATLYTRLLEFLRDEQDENSLLFFFGAQEELIRQTTIIRGLVFGLAAGLFVSLMSGVLLAIWYANAPLISGAAADLSAWAWPLVLVPTLVSTILGFIAGLHASQHALIKTPDLEITLGS